MSHVAVGTNIVVTVLLAPGIAAHEFAHELACRLLGVPVHGSAYLNPLASDAYVDHEPIESFYADAIVALAPLVVNTTFALAAFVGAVALAGTPVWPLLVWVGGTLALTAFPSHSDTASMVATARALPTVARPFGLLVAVPVRLATAIPGVSGFYGFFYAVWLYAVVAGPGGWMNSVM
ncbi:hypothetical protein [Haloarchaeobius sp. FL176]|uniref:hypothetical protein n=1 Tax=Haloarchaeobius sp. FL176 TaxID=2967129 RepID=UPI002147826C|nr:hypothetical protein [Haloarchaeobius sp. FL176]